MVYEISKCGSFANMNQPRTPIKRLPRRAHCTKDAALATQSNAIIVDTIQRNLRETTRYELSIEHIHQRKRFGEQRTHNSTQDKRQTTTIGNPLRSRTAKHPAAILFMIFVNMNCFCFFGVG